MKLKQTKSSIPAVGLALAFALSAGVLAQNSGQAKPSQEQGYTRENPFEFSALASKNITFNGKPAIRTDSQDAAMQSQFEVADKAFANAKSSAAPPYFKTVFYAGYGDKNQRPNQAEDVATNHGPWPSSPTINPSFEAQSDSIWPNSTVMAVRMNLTGYPVFNPAKVREASLKIDIFFDPTRAQGSSALYAWDDQTSNPIPLMLPTQWNLFRNRAASMFGGQARWISVVLDLTPSNPLPVAYMYDINSFGNPIANRWMGPFTSFPAASRSSLLQAAANGNLQLYALPHLPVSHAELVIKESF